MRQGPPLIWQLRDRAITFGRPLVMGILNVTPDSFSDGGQFVAADAAVAHGLEMAREGADVLDVGGESTRPGSRPVSLDEELRRVVPVVRGLRAGTDVLISVDTSKAEVARQALEAGADIVNDVTALQDPGMVQVVCDSGVGAIIMHMQGTPATMQLAPHYDDVLAEVYRFLEERLNDLERAGIARERLAVDPGIGFGKKDRHNMALLAGLPRFLDLGRPLCLGVSRKGFIGQITGRPARERAVGSVAVACHALAHQAAHVLRVHDVGPTVDAVKVIDALQNIGQWAGGSGQ